MCYECRELYCEGCSDTHLTFKHFANHTLIDLDPPQSSSKTDGNRQENAASSTDNDADAELSSDFLEQLVVSENTVLYRAQVAVEGEPEKTTTHVEERKPRNISDIRGNKMRDFSVKRTEDTKEPYITAVLILGDQFIIVDTDNRKLKCFTETGKYLSSTELNYNTNGITKLARDRFATSDDNKEIILWKLHGQMIESEWEKYKVEHFAHALHFNGMYYCVLHNKENAVTILDNCGRHVRKFVIKEAFGKKVEFGWDIHSDRDTHHVYIPCEGEIKGILCASIDGKVNNFHATDWRPRGISDIYRFLCVVNYSDSSVMLSTKDSVSMSKSLDTSDAKSRPEYISVNEACEKIIVSYYKSDIISVFAIQ